MHPGKRHAFIVGCRWVVVDRSRVASFHPTTILALTSRHRDQQDVVGDGLHFTTEGLAAGVHERCKRVVDVQEDDEVFQLHNAVAVEVGTWGHVRAQVVEVAVGRGVVVGVARIQTTFEQAKPVVLGGRCVEVERARVNAAHARFVVACAVVEGGRGVVVARTRICATRTRHEVTFSRVSGVGVVVARTGGQTTSARGKFTTAVVLVGEGVEVAGPFNHTTRHCLDARSIVVGGRGVEVDGVGVGAPQHFVEVADAVLIVVQAHAVAIESVIRELAEPAIDGVFVVVAGVFVQTTHARFVIARIVVHVGRRVVVARQRGGAPKVFTARIDRCLGVVVVRLGVRATHAAFEFARPSDGCFGVEVARAWNHAALAACEFARAVLEVHFRVVVACHGVGTPGTRQDR